MPDDQAAGSIPAASGMSFSPKHGGPPLEGRILTFDLSAAAEELRRQPAYSAGAPSGRTLVKEPDLRVVLITLRAGGCMQEHTASGPISIQTLQGTVRVRAAGETAELPAGRLMTLEPRVPHDVEGIEDSTFLLTIGRTTYDHVSELHEPG